MDWLFKHKFVSAMLILIIAGGAWYLFSAPSSSSGPVLSTHASPEVPPDAEQLVDSLTALQAVALDGAILSNPAFQALRDLSTSIAPEPVGRANPFAQLSASEIAGGSASTTAAAPAR